MTLRPEQALQAALQVKPAVPAASRTALVLGAGGRLGERILDQALGQESYAKVFAWSKGPLGTSLLKLVGVDAPDSLRADDVYCVVHQDEALSARTAAAYFQVKTEDVLGLARQVFANGAKRFILVTPISAFSQPAALYRQLQNISEMELAEIRFESLVIVRPSTWSLREKQGNPIERLFRATINQIVGSMAGKRHVPVTSATIAQAVVLHGLEATPGLTIVEPDQLVKEVGIIAQQLNADKNAVSKTAA